MKKSVTVFAMTCLAACGWSLAGELLFDGFDEYGIGPVTNNAGWITMGTAIETLPGVVSNSMPFSETNSLALPWPSGGGGGPTNSEAVYTNFNHLHVAGMNPIIRMSGWLYRENVNQLVSIWLGKNGFPLVTVGQDSGDDTILLNAIDTGVPFVTQMYAQVTVHYNMDDNKACLDYDGNRIVDWTDAGGVVNVQFDTFAVSRLSAGTGTEGAVYFDDVVVETFRDSTVAWWRFEEGSGGTSSEQLGRFAPAPLIGYSSKRVRSSSNPIYTGGSDVANRFARSAPLLGAETNAVNSVTMSNWTFEAIIRILPGTTYNSHIMDWGTGIGVNTNTLIACSWQGTQAGVAMALHDADPIPATFGYVWAISDSLKADGLWHHVGMVRTGSTVIIYIDYSALETNSLGSPADGMYIFDTNSRVAIGEALNGGNSSDPEHIFDEVRLSDRALTPNEFLHLGRPLIRSGPTDPGASSWDFDTWTIPAQTYRVQAAAGLLNSPTWSTQQTFTASGHVSTVSIPQPTGTVGFLRLEREMP